MNLCCVICRELFREDDNVRVTLCGHMFHSACINTWLQRSNSCPQCRRYCCLCSTSRVYFSTSEIDPNDVASLQENLKKVKLQIRILEAECNIANVNYLKSKMEFYKALLMVQRKEFDDVKQKLGTLQKIEILVNATTADAFKLLKEEKDSKKLAIVAINTKRELLSSEAKRTDLRNFLNQAQIDMRKQKKVFGERISALENENKDLKEKLKELEPKDLGAKSSNASVDTPLMIEPNDKRRKSYEKVRKPLGTIATDLSKSKIRSLSMIAGATNSIALPKNVVKKGCDSSKKLRTFVQRTVKENIEDKENLENK